MVARGIEFAGEETWYGGEMLSPGICMVLEPVRETIPALQREVPPTVARDIEFVREETWYGGEMSSGIGTVLGSAGDAIFVEGEDGSAPGPKDNIAVGMLEGSGPGLRDGVAVGMLEEGAPGSEGGINVEVLEENELG